MSRQPRLTFALLLTLFGACDDDGPGPTDAGRDARRDGSSGCMMADCQTMPKPRLTCMPPSFPDFTCVRAADQRCTWGQERCAPGLDGGTESDAPGTATDASDDAPADTPAGS